MATLLIRNRWHDSSIGPLKARSPLEWVMPQAVICAYARTPVGKHRGALSGFSATELGTLAGKELLQRVGIDPSSGLIDEVYLGHVLQTGAGQPPARHVAVNAG